MAIVRATRQRAAPRRAKRKASCLVDRSTSRQRQAMGSLSKTRRPVTAQEPARADATLTPRSIRELAQPTTKSALSHVWTSDTRDDPWTGTTGRLVKLTNVGAWGAGLSFAGAVVLSRSASTRSMSGWRRADGEWRNIDDSRGVL